MKKTIGLMLFIFLGINSYAQQKDTLVFDFNEKYFKTGVSDNKENNSGEYYIQEKNKYPDEDFVFSAENMCNLKYSKDPLDIKKYIRSSEYYNKQTSQINAGKLVDHFEKYVIFLSKKEDSNKTVYIRVHPATIIYN